MGGVGVAGAGDLGEPEVFLLVAVLDFREDLWFEDTDFSPCMFGSSFFKPTRVRSWGWKPARLDKKCTRVGTTFSCLWSYDILPARDAGVW